MRYYRYLLLFLLSLILAGCMDTSNDIKDDIEKENQDEVKKKQSLVNLMQNPEPMQCISKKTDPKGNVMDTETFISKERFYSETNTQTEEITKMLFDGTTFYIWNDGSKKGIKMSFNLDTDEKVDQNKSEQPINLSEEVYHTCTEWTVDETVFTVPEDVTFVDFEEQIKKLTQSMCEQCNTLSAGQIDACRENMGC
jgi:hypothetical protein